MRPKVNAWRLGAPILTVSTTDVVHLVLLSATGLSIRTARHLFGERLFRLQWAL
jgi:hypothetical protein